MLIKTKPKKMVIYVSNGKMTCAQVRQKTGCDICINGTLYNSNTMKPTCDVKVDGTVLSDDKYNYWGYGWNKNDNKATMSNQMALWDNYISCVALLKDGKKVTMTYNSDVGGKRGRSAIGYTSDGSLVIYCYKDGTSGACTPEQLATKMLSYGCVDALCLDGGGSVQMDCDQGKITSSRKVANYICIWTATEETDTNSKTNSINSKINAKCPYQEPTVNIRNGSRGTGAKWVQWHLKEIYDSELVVDGIFGKSSTNALRGFQVKVGLVNDGVCGRLTREALIKAL